MNVYRQVMIGAGMMSCVGLGLVVVAAVQFFQTRAFIRTAIVADGRVVNIESQDFSGGRFRGGYITVFTFSDATGQTHTGRTPGPSKPSTHKVGDDVIVLYPPGSPESARIRSFRTLWIIPTFLGSIGLAVSIICPIAFVSARRMYYGATHDEDVR